MEGGLENLQAMREQPWIKKYVAKQQRWLLFLRHCAKCRAPEGQCFFGDPCTTVKELWRHILTCGDPHCQYPRLAVAAPPILAVTPHFQICVGLVFMCWF